MRIYTLIIYIILSIILEMILNKLEDEKGESFSCYIVISNIYILILSGIFVMHSSNIFLVVLFNAIGNILYVTCVKEMSFNINIMVKYLFNVIVAYLLNVLFINKVDSVFLSLEQIKLIIWIFIVFYLYFSFRDTVKMKKIDNKKKLYYQDKEYIVMQYAKFKNKYHDNIKFKYREIILVVYAIMIYENYNRPKLMRKIDELQNKLFSIKCKFGIMQVDSGKYIDDITSINLTIKRLEKIYIKNNDVYKVISNYSRNNSKEIISIYREVVEFDNK